ncbi:hypothetical protein C1H46_011920 [Malus baccata]|uniref:Nudix hydrolase domain-containing protein n=1 Tax=Malus baccata TaxID=106549 RepID=A0A540MUS5_MALBA|nr:hypothetical protein C1H46_011920 [Malus baccata]
MAAKTESGGGGGREVKKVLNAVNDHYGGVIVHVTEPMEPATFVSSLTSSIAHWKLQGKKGIWIKLPIERVNLVEAAVKITNDILGRSELQEGFWYHHAEPDYLMLVYWIPQSPHTLPTNATHRVGIGAFLINQNRETKSEPPIQAELVFEYRNQEVWTASFISVFYLHIMCGLRQERHGQHGDDHGTVLVVQEKGGQYRGTGLWKLPTGAVDEGEDIFAAAVREVKEETGIDSEFVEVLAFREGHKSFFEKSDLFFLCMLRPLSFDIQKQEQEIEAAKWMPYEEYAAQPFVQKYELLKYMHDICKAKIDGKYSGFSPLPSRSYSLHKSYLYLNSSKAPKRRSKL